MGEDHQVRRLRLCQRIDSRADFTLSQMFFVDEIQGGPKKLEVSRRKAVAAFHDTRMVVHGPAFRGLDRSEVRAGDFGGRDQIVDK